MASRADNATNQSSFFPAVCESGLRREDRVAEMARSVAFDGGWGEVIVADGEKALNTFWKAVGPYSENSSQISPAFWNKTALCWRRTAVLLRVRCLSMLNRFVPAPVVIGGRSCKMARQHAQQALLWTACCPVARISHGTEGPNC